MPHRTASIDPSLPIDSKTQRDVRRSAWRRWNRNPLNGLVFGIALVTPIFFFPWISEQLTPVQAWTGIPAFLITFLIYVLYISALTLVIKRWRYTPLVFAELRDRGFDVCLGCGYWLRDLDETIANCPECGCVRTALTSTSSSTTKE
jgi:hypothetical protein